MQATSCPGCCFGAFPLGQCRDAASLWSGCRLGTGREWRWLCGHDYRRSAGRDDRRINRSDANGGEGRLLAGPAHIVYRAAGSRIDRGIGDQILGVFPVQALDGIGAGLQSVAVPGLVARILNGTGRVNVGQGAVMTIQGVGAALSPAIGGWLAQELGYPAAFTVLGCFAIGSIVIWLSFASVLKSACAGKRTGDSGAVPVPGF